eukprot:3363217-Prorocentrum_lima.AAC.1
MTSSLVGSEMCIRDSPLCLYGAACWGLPGCTPDAVTAHRHLQVDCLAPVSYTHLTLPTICSV